MEPLTQTSPSVRPESRATCLALERAVCVHTFTIGADTGAPALIHICNVEGEMGF